MFECEGQFGVTGHEEWSIWAVLIWNCISHFLFLFWSLRHLHSFRRHFLSLITSSSYWFFAPATHNQVVFSLYVPFMSFCIFWTIVFLTVVWPTTTTVILLLCGDFDFALPSASTACEFIASYCLLQSRQCGTLKCSSSRSQRAPS